MQKKLSLTISLFALLPLMVLIILWPNVGRGIPWVRAAQPDSSFTPPYNISSALDYDASQKVRAAQAADEYLHVVWMDGTLDTATGPAYVAGRDTLWPTWQWIGPNYNKGYVNPSIAIGSNGTIHVAYGSDGPPYEVWYTSKPLAGDWTTRVNLSNEGYNTVNPSVAVDSQNRVWVAWQASVTQDDEDVFVRSKPDGGAWEPGVNVSNRTAKDQNPSISVDSNDVPHIVWRSNQPGNWEIIHTSYVGGSWTPFENISASSRGSHFPRAAAGSGGNLYVVWEEELSPDVFFTAFRRWNGSQWLAMAYVSDPIKALYPSLGTDRAGNIYSVWTDYRTSGTETFFSYSTDEGATWSSDENVSQNGTASFFPDVVAQVGGLAHIFWQDSAPGALDIFYSKATVQVGPTPTVTDTPEPTLPPQPHGYVNVFAHDPLNNQNYSRLLDVTLELSATSEVGAQITDMRICNQESCNPLPSWQPFNTSLPNWSLYDDGSTCGTKSVLAWFRDEYNQESNSYADTIFFDNYLAADMLLNGGNIYVNRTMVMVNSSGEPSSCSGLSEMRLREEGGTYTDWMTFYTSLPFFLAPSGPVTRTVEVEYCDHANNTGARIDSITIERNPPYNGTPPTMISSTTQLVIQLSGLQAQDDESGVANVWIANRPNGPWKIVPYCLNPPCSYEWNLGYGGPPILAPNLHTVYAQYEDASGYRSFRGNLSPVYTATISISNIYNGYLPLLFRGETLLPAATPPAGPEQAAGLILFSDPPHASPGQDIRLYLAVPRELDTPLEGTLRMMLPEGLRVTHAWSAYGQILQINNRLVLTHERAWSGQVPWILVEARVEEWAHSTLWVQGEMTWDEEGVIATSLRIERR